MFRVAKEKMAKKFGPVWLPTGAKRMSTLAKKKPLSIMRGSSRHGRGGSARGALSRVSRVPKLRVQEDEEEQAAMSDMSIDIDYLE